MGKKLHIVLLMDINFPPPEDGDYGAYLKTPEWKNEAHVIRALRALGHSVTPVGLFDSLEPLTREVVRQKPDLVFNMCEAFRDDRNLEPHLMAFLELMGVPYTGAPPAALYLCKDKAAT